MNLSPDEIIATNINSFIQCFESKQLNDEKLVYSCRVDGCNKPYTEKSSAIRHLRKHHTEIYDMIRSEKCADIKNKANSPFVFDIRVKVNPQAIMDACADLITTHGLPLSVVEYPAFKTLLKPYVIGLQTKGVELSINKNIIKKHIENRTNEVKKIIRNETKNKMVSLMMDIATRYNRSVLGVSISYMYAGQICIRTISVHALKAAHTGVYILNLIKKILSDYEIRLCQIATVTTDNGSNMIKAVALLDAFYQSESQNRPFQPDHMEDEYEDEYHIDNAVFDEEYYKQILDEVRSKLEYLSSLDLIHGISCGAHCIHLAVSHAMENSPDILALIQKCRWLVKKLRTPTLRSKLKAQGFNMAIIDVETRWNSIFTMVRIKSSKFVCST